MKALNERGVGKVCDCWPISRCISVTVQDRLQLIANRKSYTGFRLAPNSMTLNDFERQNKGFYGFLAISDCDTSLYHPQGGATQRVTLADVYIYTCTWQ